MTQEEKDFLISYHEADREWAEWIAIELEAAGYPCILKAWDFRPGSNFVFELNKAIAQTKCTLAILTPSYLDEISTFPEWAAAFKQDPAGTRGKLIPIRVRACSPSGLLSTITPIDLVGLTESVALTTLISGVKGERLNPSQKTEFPAHVSDFPGPRNVLIASLGDSPAIITAMYDLLIQREHLALDLVRVLCPSGDDVQIAYEQVEQYFPDKQKLRYEPLSFIDADSWQHACMFLQKLCNMLEQYQERGDAVYLSLAGGRKSMAALMAWVTPFFSCVKGLYHVVSPEKEYFPSVDEIERMSEVKRSQEMHPRLDHLALVNIPFEKEKHISKDVLTKLLSSSPKEYEKVEALITGQAIFHKDAILAVRVSQRVIDQFHDLLREDPEGARIVRNSLLEMGQIALLRKYAGSDSHSCKIPHVGRVTLRSYIESTVPIRPVFYTTPCDIHDEIDEPVERVVICALQTPDEHGFSTLKEVAPAFTSNMKKTFSVDELPLVPFPEESTLIVPLGRSPLVATQLFTLLTKLELRTIREVVLIYPQRAAAIINGAKIIRDALRDEYDVDCRLVGIPGLEDITSTEHCETYQEHLVQEIKRVQQETDDGKIDLALSGGRKGMTAMTIFAAQKCDILYVYHTLIADKDTSDRIDEETTIDALNETSLSQEEERERLFLRAYEVEGPDPYANFVLFRVPVFTAEDW
jgi:TIR domain/CRISPR-associated protein NE0113 (Cas_NE0113)